MTAFAFPVAPDIIYASKDITFTGGAGAGAVGTVTYLTASGDVDLIWYTERCVTSLVGAGTYEVGVTGSTQQMITQILNATAIDAGMVYNNDEGAFNATFGDPKRSLGSADHVLASGTTIFATVGTNAITAGVMRAYYAYRPLTAGATLS